MKSYVLDVKWLYIALCGVFLTIFIVTIANIPRPIATTETQTVVIDAGHGGIDAGALGTYTNVRESDINLAVARQLRTYLEKAKINVVMTRDSLDGLYGNAGTGFKRRDMQKRKQIIESAMPNLMVSVHMNKIDLESCRGAQVFYHAASENSKNAATAIQNNLNTQMEYARPRVQKTGDYYMLNCTKYTSVIVECGFLSNREEEKLLQDKDYQQKIAYAIYLGITSYLTGGKGFEKI